MYFKLTSNVASTLINKILHYVLKNIYKWLFFILLFVVSVCVRIEGEIFFVITVIFLLLWDIFPGLDVSVYVCK